MPEPVYVWNNIDVSPFLTLRDNIPFKLDDVIGSEHIIGYLKRELFLTDEQLQFMRSIGLTKNHSYLFFGLPGSGKTRLMFALADAYQKHYGNVPVIDVNCAALREGYVGKTEANIEALFAFARQFERCVMILDEFEAIGYDRARDTIDPINHCVPALIRGIQGFVRSDTHLLLASLVHPDEVDPALPMRFAMQFEVAPLTYEGILKRLEKEIGRRCDASVDLQHLAASLKEKIITHYDLDRFIKNLKTALFEEVMRNRGDKIDAALAERILQNAESTIRQKDLDVLEAYKQKHYNN